jgi:alpha-amylase/alpha-mannosidase (GH57 family)
LQVASIAIGGSLQSARSINLLLAIHNHQPVGNFDFVFQDSYDRAYKPFLDLLAKHPRVKVSLHYTGPLLDWFSRHRPEFYSKIGALLDAGQVEMMTGAYYEAILSVIPEEDGKGQIRKLSDTIKRDFHDQPTGMWLAERVWEQHIARPIAESGVKFVLLDDTHFLSAGLKEDDLVGYYLTEERGSKLALFPTSKTLRYTIPFQPVQQTIDLLRSLASDAGDRVVTFGDDGEKFGVWPTTYKHVYEDGWLEEFFAILEANSDWLHIRHFSDILHSIPPIGRIYLPDSSYMEMGHWVLSPEAFHRFEEFSELLEADEPFGKYRQFVKGGFWRNFLVKYPEANTLHKKMLYLSKRAHSLERKGKKVADALEYLWAGQCNDAYWHGVFGGLYLPHIRAEAFRNLLRAENILNSTGGFEGIRAKKTDFDCDGHDELLAESSEINAYFKLDAGGSIFELDFLPISTNLGNVMTRREEGYHQKLLAMGKEASSSSGSPGVASIHDLVLKKEENLDQYLAYDWYRRASLVDHFLGDGVTLEDFSKCRFAEQGDFVNQPYEFRAGKKGQDLRINLWREGHVWSQNRHLPLRVSKTAVLRGGISGIELDYEIENSTKELLDLWFGIEFCFALSAGDAPDRYYRFNGSTPDDMRLRSVGALKDVSSMSLIDEWLGIDVALSFAQPAEVWRFPIETISLSEGGFERVYQGSVVFPNWHIRLETKWACRILLELKRISKL